MFNRRIDRSSMAKGIEAGSVNCPICPICPICPLPMALPVSVPGRGTHGVKGLGRHGAVQRCRLATALGAQRQRGAVGPAGPAGAGAACGLDVASGKPRIAMPVANSPKGPTHTDTSALSLQTAPSARGSLAPGSGSPSSAGARSCGRPAAGSPRPGPSSFAP